MGSKKRPRRSPRRGNFFLPTPPACVEIAGERTDPVEGVNPCVASHVYLSHAQSLTERHRRPRPR
jgi:hypothetical protein